MHSILQWLSQVPSGGWFALGCFIGAFMGVFLMGTLAAGGRADEQLAFIEKMMEKEDKIKHLEEQVEAYRQLRNEK